VTCGEHVPVAVCCTVLQCVAVCCSELQWVAVLQCVAVCCSEISRRRISCSCAAAVLNWQSGTQFQKPALFVCLKTFSCALTHGLTYGNMCQQFHSFIFVTHIRGTRSNAWLIFAAHIYICASYLPHSWICMTRIRRTHSYVWLIRRTHSYVWLIRRTVTRVTLTRRTHSYMWHLRAALIDMHDSYSPHSIICQM